VSNTSVETFADSDALTTAAGERLIDAIEAAVAARGRAQIVLTGGGTLIRLMSYLRAQAGRVDWAKVHVFWGDERYVTEDDNDRNDKGAREALLDHVDIPPRNVHAMPARDGEFDSDLAAAALAYEQLLAANAESGEPAPNFDVFLLGVGPEGHINSLFPETPAVRETTQLVLGVEDSPKPPPRRITLTLPAIRRSREVWLLVSGAEKADAVAAALGGADPVSIPAAGAIGQDGTVWFLDSEAASKIRAGQASS
jgi:6-phosphogluconolactonase